MHKVRPWLEGAGFSLLYLYPPLTAILSSTHREIYHALQPVTTLSRGLLIDLLVLTVVAGLYIRIAKRSTGRTFELLWLPILVAAAAILYRDAGFLVTAPAVKGRLLDQVRTFPAAAVVLLVLCWWVLPRLYRRLPSLLSVFLAAAGIAAVVVVSPQLAIHCFSKQPAEAASFRRVPPFRGPAEAPRIVWLLFDELSYNQVYAHRAAGLPLPAFDRLASESLVASDLQPVGDRTDVVIPSLFLGQPSEDIESDTDGHLLWRASAGSPWLAYSPQDTIFASAHRMHWTTGVAGWYNPYCRILGPVLDRCDWVYAEAVPGEPFMATGLSTWQNAVYGLPLVSHLDRMIGQKGQTHLSDYGALMAEGKSLIADTDVRFAFIHLPIPHMPAIYRRPGGTKQHQGSYLDNLALADQTLAELRKAIEATPAAASTTLIVSSDHSWRVNLLRGSEVWSREDEQASNGGQFDDRPVLVIHFPGETTPDRLDRPTSAMAVHDILFDLLSGKVDDEAGLKQELQTRTAGSAAE